ncbi:MAG: CAP domain-containing protein [Steroidobacteraceae bacterium]
MERSSLRRSGCLLVLFCGLSATHSWADPVSAVQLLRASGCGGVLPAAEPLRHNELLDRAAARWAGGGSVAAATSGTGYRAQATAGLRLSGPDDSTLQVLRRTQCRTVAARTLRDFGLFRRAAQTWMVMAEPAPGDIPASQAARRVLQLVNEVRAAGTRCGEKLFGSAPPLRMSALLDGVAAEHAADMARHDYFEHVDLNGNTPADRVRAAGYRETLVGENIAYGPSSAQEVVDGWLHSAGHCRNIMDARFLETGLAVASGRGTRRGLYWDQVLTNPAR